MVSKAKSKRHQIKKWPRKFEQRARWKLWVLNRLGFSNPKISNSQSGGHRGLTHKHLAILRFTNPGQFPMKTPGQICMEINIPGWRDRQIEPPAIKQASSLLTRLGIADWDWGVCKRHGSKNEKARICAGFWTCLDFLKRSFGGGGGNRTPVQWHATYSSTYLARLLY